MLVLRFIAAWFSRAMIAARMFRLSRQITDVEVRLQRVRFLGSAYRADIDAVARDVDARLRRVRRRREEMAAIQKALRDRPVVPGGSDPTTALLSARFHVLQAQLSRDAKRLAWARAHLRSAVKRAEPEDVELQYLSATLASARREVVALREQAQLLTRARPIARAAHERLPGRRTLVVLALFYSSKTMTRVFEPIIADVQHDWTDARDRGASAISLLWIELRGYLALASVITRDCLAVLRAIRGLGKAVDWFLDYFF